MYKNRNLWQMRRLNKWADCRCLIGVATQTLTFTGSLPKPTFTMVQLMASSPASATWCRSALLEQRPGLPQINLSCSKGPPKLK